MKGKGFCLLIVLLLVACHSSSTKNSSGLRDLSKIKIGMPFDVVLKLVGAPDTIVRRGIVYDEFSSQTKTDEWYYGNNQIVLIVNDTVNAIDLNAEATRQKIQHIIDSARAAEGNSTHSFSPLNNKLLFALLIEYLVRLK